MSSNLFTKRRFFPYFVTQALGAFNDNVYKNALLLLVTFTLVDSQTESTLYANLAAGLFILPFFVFSPIGGQLADKYEKSYLIRCIKFSEILIMLLAAAALYFKSLEFLLGILFLMGTQSAFFGPVKFSLLPQHLGPKELISGNAYVEMGTFLAILLGTIYSGVLMSLEQYAIETVALSVVVIAVLGFLSSLKIPEAESGNPNLKMNWNPWSETWQTFKSIRDNKAVFLSIFAISWFWFIGSAYLTQFPAFTKNVLHGNAQVVTLLLTLFSIGIALGSILCEKYSGKKIELGLVPIGSIGMSIFGLDLYFSVPNLNAEVSSLPFLSFTEFLKQEQYWRMLVDFMLLSIFAGLYIVPLNALIQQRTELKQRSQVIAANNVMNALFMVLSAVIAIVLLGPLGLSIQEFFLVLAIGNVIVAFYVYTHVSEFLWRFFVFLLSHTMYRVKHQNFDEIPDDGPILLVCNHVSYVDALLIAGACRRPVRFVMDKGLAEIPVLKHILKFAKTIPICSPKRDKVIYERSFELIKAELDEGNIVCIFPEGKLTTDGRMDQFKKGVEKIIEQSPVPVIPLALLGLWGSFFSHKDGNAMAKKPRRFWSKVLIKAGTKVAPEMVSATYLEDQVRLLIDETDSKANDRVLNDQNG